MNKNRSIINIDESPKQILAKREASDLKRAHHEIYEIVSNYLREIDGEVYSGLLMNSIQKKFPRSDRAFTEIKSYEEDGDPEPLSKIVADRDYYKSIGYPMDRKKKTTTKPKRKIVKKCKCK